MNVLYCNCSYCDIIPADTKAVLRATLKSSEHNLLMVDDLCGLLADKKPLELDKDAEWIVLACYPRTIVNLLGDMGLDLAKIDVINMLSTSLEDILASLNLAPLVSQDDYQPPAVDWTPWYPIIDQVRCTNCQQCVTFCPFGVYEIIDKKVIVTNPKKCKNNCPACARVCPSSAIIFPKCPDNPINGAEVEAPKTDVLEESDDLHDILQRRKAFSKARDPESDV